MYSLGILMGLLPISFTMSYNMAYGILLLFYVIGINKDVNVLVNGCKFIDSLRKMLMNFNIKTTNTWITSPIIRKDGGTSKQIVFSIRSKENIIRFRNEIDFNNVDRKKKLAEAVREFDG